ncbi:MAG TPA: PTS sugar transporter subunit IIA [Candidatus Enterocloster excrementipullorum]|uniref:PTS sugar transporter subunit IIA n=1 Tax=Candidatus Enterocloster excrementipullorum TaxID=2838559 RepID=A0A9D2MXA6_9FIRM|nr:PTS sugar transporter subunit IIA [Candidatus Enterocloster excrementipullorum]
MITENTTLRDVLSEELIQLEMNGSTRKEVLEEFAEMFERAGALTDKEQFLRDAWGRESEGPTGIGGQIAIPHSKSAGVKTTMMAVGRTRQPVEWPSLEGETCQAFVMFAVREDDKTQLVTLLAQAAVALCYEEVTKTLLYSNDKREIVDALCRKERE